MLLKTKMTSVVFSRVAKEDVFRANWTSEMWDLIPVTYQLLTFGKLFNNLSDSVSFSAKWR